MGYHAKIINSGRAVNDAMGAYVGNKTVKMILSTGKSLIKSKVLVMGATFKEDVSDIRNSKVVDVINEIKSFSCEVEVVDPHADSDELNDEYGFELANKINAPYDAVVVAVNHKEYVNLDEKYFQSILTEKGVLVDIKGIYKDKIAELDYWTL